jgi:cell division protein FtsW (lipid II flippase)
LSGYERDNVCSTIASVMAVGVALFPTASDAGTASSGAKVIATMHLAFACTLFVLLAIFSLFFFTQSDKTQDMGREKRRRNLVYRVCGWIIVAAIGLVVLTEIAKPPSTWHTLFWLESVAVVSFGVSWLVKGGFRGWLADKQP